MQRLTITHVRRWQEHRGYAGLGHVYQGRYKSFPVESDEHFWVVARYVERNALRAESRLASGGMVVVKLVATLSSYGRRAVVVGGVADRYASELARAGQSNRRRAGTGSALPQRATRPPLWPAGMAEGNRATFGPRVGLSSHGSPAKGGPKSKCLARLKIARTSAGPPSLTISDPSRFPLASLPSCDMEWCRDSGDSAVTVSTHQNLKRANDRTPRKVPFWSYWKHRACPDAFHRASKIGLSSEGQSTFTRSVIPTGGSSSRSRSTGFGLRSISPMSMYIPLTPVSVSENHTGGWTCRFPSALR